MSVNQPVIFAAATVASTLVGGAVTFRARGSLRFVLAFTTGVLLGIVSFDLLPDIVALVQLHGLSMLRPMLALTIGFLVFRSVEHVLLTREPGVDGSVADRRHRSAGLLSAAALIGHSAFDGVSIGLAFQLSTAIGLAVAFAVIGHDFADGINTVSVMLAHGNSTRRAVTMLVLDAVAPLVGVASTLFVHFSAAVLVLYIGFFAGFLLHVATSASHGATATGARGRTAVVVGLTWVGAAFALAVTQAAG